MAGKLKAPVVLVDGLQSSLPSNTLDELIRMGLTDVIIAAGTGAISAGIETQLTNSGYTATRHAPRATRHAPRATRHDGAYRNSTATLMNDAYFPSDSTDTMLLANGTNLPDELAGAASAGLIGAPLYTTAPACAPTQIHDSVVSLNPSKTVVLGGTAVLSTTAANNVSC